MHKFDQYDKNFSYESFTTNVTSDPIGLQVLATGVVRKIIECFFQQRELRWLDDLLPGAGKKESEKVLEVYSFTQPPLPTPLTIAGMRVEEKWLSNSWFFVHNVARDVQSSFLYLEFIYREDLRIESLISPFPVLFYRLKNC